MMPLSALPQLPVCATLQPAAAAAESFSAVFAVSSALPDAVMPIPDQPVAAVQAKRLPTVNFECPRADASAEILTDEPPEHELPAIESGHVIPFAEIVGAAAVAATMAGPCPVVTHWAPAVATPLEAINTAARALPDHSKSPDDAPPQSFMEANADTTGSSFPNHRPASEPVAVNATPASPTAAPQLAHQLDLARDLAWIGNLAQEIIAASDDGESLRFRLLPQSLGQLDVQLARSSEGLKVEMTATAERAAQIIAAEQPRLIEELRQSGVKMAGVDLSTSQHNGSRHPHPPPRNAAPFAAAQPQSTQARNRPDGRFA